MSEEQCKRCEGSGKVWGDSDNEVALPVAMKIPYESIALPLAMSPPRECPDCKGTGRRPHRRCLNERMAE